MRVADYVAKYLYCAGIDTVFMVTGGGAMHLNDAFGRHGGFSIVFCHHEQACAMAADAYFRVSGKPAVVQVTTGPGSINALNGVFGAFVDSVPMIVVSGQVRTDTISSLINPELRQVGDQEVRISEVVANITKFVHLITSVDAIPNIIQQAYGLAVTGRPGPVWIDIPIDIQGASINAKLPADPNKTIRENEGLVPVTLVSDAILKALESSERPVIIAGNGVRFSGTVEALRDFGQNTGVPITTVWNAHDIIPNDHPSYCGRTGADGDRAGNFSVQNADLIIILGARMAIRQVGFNYKAFGRAAKKIMVDLDVHEMNKPTINIDQKFVQDLAELVPLLAKVAGDKRANKSHKEYGEWCRQKVAKFPTVLPHHFNTSTGLVNPYAFVDFLFSMLPEKCNIVTGDGTAAVVTFKAAKIQSGHRLFTNKGCASMGFDLPASIGAYFADKETTLVCIAGDGSLMMNLQELQTIVGLKLPLKLFVLNNDGYHSIRQSQTNYFNGFEVGCGPESGVTFPDFEKLAKAFGFSYLRVENESSCRRSIAATLAASGPFFCEVMIDKNQLFEPRLSSRKLENGDLVSSPLEDMSPFLPRDQFAAEMIIAPLEEN